MAVVNIGILAHVDAGKTSLTERILYQTGILDEPGSVDAGSTVTDTMALERERGITIRAAVASFRVGDLKVNLIDTPGHADFVAEVERALRVLDGVVLVVSAVEGVQPQTRRLMRTLRALRMPTLLFVNKVDRLGAREASLLDSIRATLTPDIVPVSTVTGIGTAGARVRRLPVAGAAVTDLLAERRADADDAFLAEYVTRGWRPTPGELAGELRRASRAGRVHPVYFGSAVTGAGVADLLDGIADHLPPAPADVSAPLSGTVFAMRRGARGERVAYLRLFGGRLPNRRTLPFFRDGTDGYEARPTGVAVFEGGRPVPVDAAPAGEIAQVTGLVATRIGDRVGTPAPVAPPAFPPPTLESVVTPVDPARRSDLYPALCRLADQDPMIRVRTVGDEVSVCLFGEVQKEVVAATLATEYGVAVTFAPTRTICVEKPAGVGEAVEYIGHDDNPFFATVGLRVEPGTGIGYRLAVEPGSLLPAFLDAVAVTVAEQLRQGPHGWQVTDCLVTLTHTGYWAPVSAAGDFRRLTPLVLAEALRRAGTVVYQPLWRFELRVPAGTAGDTLAAVCRAGGTPSDVRTAGGVTELAGTVPAGSAHDLERVLPRVTRGEGDLVIVADDPDYAVLPGPVPTRARSGPDPANREEYLRLLRNR